ASNATATVRERHRHRYEVNNALLPVLQEQGLIASGWSPDGRLVEICELRDHPWIVAAHFPPECTSRPTHPQPLFRDFVGAALKRTRQQASTAARTATAVPRG